MEKEKPENDCETYIESISKLDIKENDSIICRLSENAPIDKIKGIMGTMELSFPSNKVLLVQPDISIT